MSCSECDVNAADDYISFPRRGKVNRFIKEIFKGVKSRYPICCAFRFAFETALNDGKIIHHTEGAAEKRGVVDRWNGGSFVPCNIFHYKTREFDEEYTDLEVDTMWDPHMGKLYAFWSDFRNGIKDKFPLCCILRFAFESASRDGKIRPISDGQAVKRGAVEVGDKVWVPCNIFHHKTTSWDDKTYE